MASVAKPASTNWSKLLLEHWLLVGGALTIVVPTLLALARGPWTTESGVHGVFVLATGIWLIVRRWPEVKRDARPGSLPVAMLLMLPAIAVYIFGRAFDFISLEVAAMLLALLATAYAFVGAQVIKSMWFPIVYLGFVVPLPLWFIDAITQPLKLFVSEVVTWVLGLFGYPIARVGVTIYVGQYQLLVEDACAGLNSLISLTAIGLFYIYILHNTNWRYSLLLLALVWPVAVLANCVRVAALVLITYHFGDAAAQGFLHGFAGIVTFTSALLLIFLFDSLLTPVRHWLERN